MCEEVSKIASSFLSHDSINEAIDSLRFLGDVGDTDLYVLERILPHCTIDQLMHIENSSKGRDLTPVTDKLWRNFYEKKFGKNDSDLVIERMKYKKESFKWKQLYEAKMEALEKKAIEIEARYKQNCQKENTRKQSRQIIFCEDVSSPKNKKRRSEGTMKFGCNSTKSKLLKKPVTKVQMCQVSSRETTKPGNCTKQSKILKKAKREALQCIETKNVIAFRRNAMQK